MGNVISKNLALRALDIKSEFTSRFGVNNSKKIIEIFPVSWSDFLSKIVKNGQILVRFSGKLGQIVSQIFANLSQLLIISTLFLGF